MQLLISNQDHGNFLRGDILIVKPDTHFWTALEVMSKWLAADAVAFPNGVPADLVGLVRTTGNFPHPHFAVARFPSYRYDMNLHEPWLASDGENREGKRLWYLDLDALPPGQRNSLEAAGGEGTLGANRLDTVKNRHDGLSLDDMVGWVEDTSQGNNPHRHGSTYSGSKLGTA